jgi:hypothetical protein
VEGNKVAVKVGWCVGVDDRGITVAVWIALFMGETLGCADVHPIIKASTTTIQLVFIIFMVKVLKRGIVEFSSFSPIFYPNIS